MSAPSRDSHGCGWMVRGSGLVLASGWGLGKVTGRMGVKWQQQLRRRRKGEKEESTLVIQDLLVLQMLPLDPKVLEIHIVQSGPEGKRGETDPTGRE